MAFGIICEYNPFHNGHLRQISEIKKTSDEPIICVMSGNFTQRGEIAITDKYARAEMALLGGADLVLELPVPFCISSAEYFASCGVGILHSAGVDKISFGSECADADKITKLAAIASSPEFKEECEQLSKKEGSALSYFSLLEKRASEQGIDAQLLSNDILAIEYTKAIIKNGYSMQIYPVKRKGDAYRKKSLTEGVLPSATAIRESIEKGNFEQICGFVPETTFEILKEKELSSLNYAKEGILLALRMADEQNLNVAINDRGLVNRILSTARECVDFDEFEQKLQTKKYTSSAIRRAILYIVLGVTQTDLDSMPVYTTVLGASERGREHLASIRKAERKIKIITKPADAMLIDDAEHQNRLSQRADALYTLCFETKKESGHYIKKNPVIK